MGETIAKFEDKYGEEREIHKTRHGLQVRRARDTIISKLNPIVSQFAGGKIKELRIERGMTLEDLCVKSGLQSVCPKTRMWEIENNTRQHGTRLGTLYAVAAALNVEVFELIPSLNFVLKKAKISKTQILSL